MEACTLLIVGLNWDTTEDTVRDYFGQYGKVTRVAIVVDPSTQLPYAGIAFVDFSDPSVLRAVVGHTHVIDGRTIQVQPAVPFANIEESLVMEEKSQFDQNSTENMTLEHLVQRFDKMKVENDELKRAFGDMKFEFDEIKRLVKGANMGHQAGEGSGEGRDRGRRIYVGGISPTVTDEQLKQYFQSYGRVTEATIKVNRGFGHVLFDSEDDVDRLLKQNAHHEINGKFVEVKPALPKETLQSTSTGHGSSSSTLDVNLFVQPQPQPPPSYGYYAPPQPPSYGYYGPSQPPIYEYYGPPYGYYGPPQSQSYDYHDRGPHGGVGRPRGRAPRNARRS